MLHGFIQRLGLFKVLFHFLPDGTAVQRYNVTDVQRYGCSALQLFSVTAFQRYSCSVLQLFSVTAVQR